MTAPLRAGARALLGVFLLVAGTAHLVVPDVFAAQVPTFLPAPGAIIFVSGLIELALGGAVLAVRRRPATVGWLIAAWFVVIVPGNIWQATAGIDAFGLTTDASRWIRVAFQPVLVIWAVWSTGAWRHWRTRTETGR